MKKLFNAFLLVCLIGSSSTNLFATHNRAGEISFRQTSANSVEAFVITYSKTSSVPADRDSLTICWGDNACERIVRINGPDPDGDGIGNGEILANDYKLNIYRAEHTYSETGIYTMYMEDPNRNDGILNVNFPNSVQVTFCVEASIDLTLDNQNNSPVLLEHPIDIAYVGQPFIHIPNAFDLDDDSIAYELVTPLSAPGTDVPNYLMVDAISPGANNTVSFDETTGMFIWDAPQREGQYNIAIKVKSYRNGTLIDYIIRDMQILVKEEDNLIPDITSSIAHDSHMEVGVGDTVRATLSMSDMEQDISISSSSGLYDYFPESASFDFSLDGNSGDATFEWIVKAEHVRDQPYQVVFSAADALGLANHILVRFKAVDQVTNVKESGLIPFKVKLYPNPAAEVLHIQLSEPLQNAQYVLLNQNGQTIQSGQLNESATEVDIQHLPKGHYFIKVRNAQHLTTKSFILK